MTWLVRKTHVAGCQDKSTDWASCDHLTTRSWVARSLYSALYHFDCKKWESFWFEQKKHSIIVNTKFLNCRKSNNWKEIWFANINLYWWIMSTISISNLLQKNTFWFYLHWTWLEQEIFLTLVGRWIERSSQRISGFELITDLLSFKPFECSSSSSKILQVLQKFLRQNFSRAWASWKLGLQNEKECPLFIVVSEDKLHFELIFLKRCSRLLNSPNLLRDNYLYLSILINIIFW